METLLLGSFSSYINPTEQLLPNVLAQAGHVTCVGPGYRASPDLQPKDLSAFVRTRGVNAILLDTSVTLLCLSGRRRDLYKSLKAAVGAKGTFEDYERLADLATRARGLGIPVIASLLRLDLHAWRESWGNRLMDLADAFLGVDPDHAPDLKGVRDALKDPLFREPIEGHYFDFARRYRDRLIPFPHFVAAPTDAPTRRRRPHSPHPLWAIPGVPYAERRIAAQSLRAAGAKTRTSHAFRAVSLSTRIGVGQRLATHYARSRYRQLIAGAEVAFVSGSALGLPVRKFFEVPALGCLMVATPFHAMESLGFIAGEHYIPSVPEHLPEVQSWLIGNPIQAARIANRGFELVWTKHSASARAQMLQEVVASSQNGLPTVRWKNGDWLLD